MRNLSYKRFKTVRLTAIRNEAKQIISVSGGLEVLQMVSESALSGVLARMLGPQGGGL